MYIQMVNCLIALACCMPLRCAPHSPSPKSSSTVNCPQSFTRAAKALVERAICELFLQYESILKKGVGSEAVCAMRACRGALATRGKAFQAGSPPQVGDNAAHMVVRCRRDRNWINARVDAGWPEGQSGRPEKGGGARVTRTDAPVLQEMERRDLCAVGPAPP